MSPERHFHHIQKSIILSLVSSSPLRFKDLQPPRVANNTFSYHLRRLLEAGYIENTPKGYMATRKALKMVVYEPQTARRNRPNPSIITAIFVTNDKGEVLLINRNNEPFRGWYGIPSGLIHNGETILEAAKRELHEKTTLNLNDSLVERGVLDFRYVNQLTGDIFIHAVAFVYSCRVESAMINLNDMVTKYGQLSWSTLKRNNILPEVFEIANMVTLNGSGTRSVDFHEPANKPSFAN